MLTDADSKSGASFNNKDGNRIIFISSQIAQVAIYGYTAYASSKWALRGIAEALQMELKPYNIWDGAVRWRKGMYVGNDALQVVSFQIKKRVNDQFSWGVSYRYIVKNHDFEVAKFF